MAQIPGLAQTQHKSCLSYNGPSKWQLAKVVLLCNFAELKMPSISPSMYPGPMLLSQMVFHATQWLQLLARPPLRVIVMTHTQLGWVTQPFFLWFTDTSVPRMLQMRLELSMLALHLPLVCQLFPILLHAREKAIDLASNLMLPYSHPSLACECWMSMRRIGSNTRNCISLQLWNIRTALASAQMWVVTLCYGMRIGPYLFHCPFVSIDF